MTTTTDESSAAAKSAGEERISWFPVLDSSEQDPDVRALCERALARGGLVPNVFRVYAWRPQRFLKWFAHFRDVLRGTPGLSEAERELIGAVVSYENHCVYCLTAHGASARALIGDPVLVDRAVVDYKRAGLDERTQAMLEYALKITRNSVECSVADIERLRRVGFADADIWDIAEVAAMFNFTNRIANATGMMPNREYHSMARS
ncbi:MAG TPA: peroxidase-related enzyme [Steroidobacteraceae bacterium]|nr:peroxidase-related enzyme [Steroidobacteraceae bacterium]